MPGAARRPPGSEALREAGYAGHDSAEEAPPAERRVPRAWKEATCGAYTDGSARERSGRDVIPRAIHIPTARRSLIRGDLHTPTQRRACVFLLGMASDGGDGLAYSYLEWRPMGAIFLRIPTWNGVRWGRRACVFLLGTASDGGDGLAYSYLEWRPMGATGLRIPTWNGGRPGRLGSYVELCLFIKSRPGGTAGAGEHVILIHINTGLTQNSGLICSVAVGGGLAARRGRAGQPILFKRNVADGRVVRRDLFWWTPLPFTGGSQGVDHSKLRAIRAIHA
jgi:hypothetical protein